jgi:hypothetical protein
MAGMTSTQEQHTLNPKYLGTWGITFFVMGHGPTLFVPFSSQKVPTCRLRNISDREIWEREWERERETWTSWLGICGICKKHVRNFFCVFGDQVTKHNFYLCQDLAESKALGWWHSQNNGPRMRWSLSVALHFENVPSAMGVSFRKGWGKIYHESNLRRPCWGKIYHESKPA